MSAPVSTSHKSASDAPAAPRPWLFESIIAARRDNDRNLLWVCGAYLALSFLAIAFNLGAIEAVRIDLLGIDASFASAWPIRVMLVIACAVGFVSVLYLVNENLRLQAGLDYLARQNAEDAVQIARFSDWLSKERPFISRARTLAIGAFVGFGALVLIIDIATLVTSFDPP